MGPELKLWWDGSKLDTGGTGAAVVWKSHRSGEEWQTVKVSLGPNKGNRNVGNLRSY